LGEGRAHLIEERIGMPAIRAARRRPFGAGAAAAAALAGAAWSRGGPFAPGWAARAGGGTAHAAVAARPAGAAATRAVRHPTAVVHAPFTARYAGRLTVEPVNDRGRLTVRIDGALSGATRDHLEILIHGIPLEDGGVAMEQSRVRMGTTTPLYQGEITSLDGTRLVAAVRSPRQRLRLGLVLQIGRDGSVVGQVQGTTAA
jgi:hypothetical protein